MHRHAGNPENAVQMPVLRLARLRLITLFGLTVFFAANGPTGRHDRV